jgi:hypothetical protein
MLMALDVPSAFKGAGARRTERGATA